MEKITFEKDSKERQKHVKDTCKRMVSWGCEIVEVYVSLWTGVVIITFKHEKQILDIISTDIKETLEETLQCYDPQNKPKKRK
jgi:hypothetical protein